jgi:hypothetical protein
VKRTFGIALGILIAIGGFVDIGDIVANTETGARFGMSLAWVVIVGVVRICLFAEMAGRRPRCLFRFALAGLPCLLAGFVWLGGQMASRPAIYAHRFAAGARSRSRRAPGCRAFGVAACQKTRRAVRRGAIRHAAGHLRPG